MLPLSSLFYIGCANNFLIIRLLLKKKILKSVHIYIIEIYSTKSEP